MQQHMLSMPHCLFRLMRFHKPIGIFLLLWPTLWALWIASNGKPPLLILIIFLIGTIIMRAAGCVINDIADRNFDYQVRRTRTRPITTKQLTLKTAIILLILLYLIAFSLTLLLNTLTIQLACMAASLSLIYPFAKRYTHWPQLILGMAFSFSILMAFAATLEKIPLIAWCLFLVNTLWTMTYDTQYAMIDRKDDIKIGLKSTAVLWGEYDCLFIAVLQATIIVLMTSIGFYLKMHWPYYWALTGGIGCFLYHQYLIKQRNPSSYLKAFENNHWFGLTVFLGITASYLLY